MGIIHYIVPERGGEERSSAGKLDLSVICHARLRKGERPSSFWEQNVFFYARWTEFVFPACLLKGPRDDRERGEEGE